MHHEMISLTSPEGQNFTGYLAKPNEAGPGILLIQEIFGINHSIRDIADNFANEGYTVLAPDLFWRIKPDIQLDYEGSDLEEAFDYYHKFDVKTGVADIGEAIKTLRHHPHCTGKVATLGFCLGGKLSFLTAAHHKPDAAIVFYGVEIADHLNEVSHIQCPLLMHFGAEDEMIPETQLEDIKTAFKNRPNVEMYIYPKVGHAFYNHHRNTYNAEAATLAHQRTLAFLKKAL